MIDETVLTTPRLRLIVPAFARAAELAAYFRDNRGHLEPWGPPMPDSLFTPAYWEEKHALHAKEREEGASLRLVVLNEERVVGVVSLFDVSRGPRECATLGFSLARAAEGRGFMTEAASAALAHGFSEMRLHRIEATHDAANLRSARVLARLGFEIDGRARKYLFSRAGWRDHVLLSKLAPEEDRPPEGLASAQ